MEAQVNPDPVDYSSTWDSIFNIPQPLQHLEIMDTIEYTQLKQYLISKGLPAAEQLEEVTREYIQEHPEVPHGEAITAIARRLAEKSQVRNSDGANTDPMSNNGIQKPKLSPTLATFIAAISKLEKITMATKSTKLHDTLTELQFLGEVHFANDKWSPDITATKAIIMTVFSADLRRQYLHHNATHTDWQTALAWLHRTIDQSPDDSMQQAVHKLINGSYAQKGRSLADYNTHFMSLLQTAKMDTDEHKTWAIQTYISGLNPPISQQMLMNPVTNQHWTSLDDCKQCAYRISQQLMATRHPTLNAMQRFSYTDSNRGRGRGRGRHFSHQRGNYGKRRQPQPEHPLPHPSHRAGSHPPQPPHGDRDYNPPGNRRHSRPPPAPQEYGPPYRQARKPKYGPPHRRMDQHHAPADRKHDDNRHNK